ncbi:DUF6463 family protein [Dysgonomonas termitidis]|uniref:DUF6463 family protein n=1 Tax=Dysgonomonas termitidis TaxID=1516126 RepID=A0ABV9L1P1_9BACT
MKLWKYSGVFLMITGILHVAIAILEGKETLVAILKDGFDSIGSDVLRNQAFWFLICGVIIIFWGQTLHFYIKKTRTPLPSSLGWSLLIISLVGCFFVPVSGFWLFIPQALIMILASRNSKAINSEQK